jgi:hypothetical protein
VSGALVAALAARIFGGAAGALASVVFFLMPGLIGYAHSSMSEMRIVLAHALYYWRGGN